MGPHRTPSQTLNEVIAFCRIPRKQSDIIRSCNLNYYPFRDFVKRGILKLHKIELKGRGSKHGIKYWVTKNELIRKLNRNVE